MKVDVETLEGCKRRLAVEAPAEVVEKAWERAWERVQKQARLAGFRKGHVPRSLVKLHFGDDVRRDVAEHLIPDVYRDALTEAHIEPTDEPDLQDVQLEEGAPLKFVALVEVKPTIELKKYKGLTVQQQKKSVTESDVADALEQVREGNAQLRVVERPAQRGDVVLVDYTLTPEGMPGSGENGYAFVVGEGNVLPEIDEAVVGMVAGEEREVPVRFRDDHRREDLRGRSGVAHVKVSEVKEKVLPMLDDELAKSVGDFDTLEALRAEVTRQLEARRANDEQQALESAMVDALLAEHEFAVPDAAVTRQIAHQVEHAREGVRRQGVDPDRLPWDYKKLATDLRPAAEKAVRRDYLLEAIAQRESIQPSDADIDAEVEKLAKASGRPAPAVRRLMEKSGDLQALRNVLRDRMTLDFLIRHATVTE